MKAAKSKKRYILKYIAVALIFTLFGILLSNSLNVSDEKPATIMAKSHTINLGEQDPTLLGYAKELKATYINGVDISYVDHYNKEGQWGEYSQGYEGDLMSDGTTQNKIKPLITILSGHDADDTKRFLAHEYMHHAWYTQINLEDQTKLSSELIVSYSKDNSMQARSEYYTKDNKLTPTELLSIYCTESSDPYLTPEILATCNKYINRSALVMLR